jgi:hypothetical protein
MSYTVTKYPQGTFSWADVFSTDMEKSKHFMKELMGWTSEDMPTTEGRPDYTMFYLDGKAVAGGSPAYMEGMPSFWSNYISVDDIEAMVQKAQDLGGKVTMPAMDVMDSGRMAVIQDPTGAMVSLWQPKDHIGAQVVNKVGAMCWNELMTPDLEKAKTFYTDMFGWTYEMEKDNSYAYIKNNGRSNGGMMPLTPEMGDTPPSWVPYFTVASADETEKTVKKLGGQVHMKQSIEIGTFVVISDPAGAAFVTLEMTVEPDHWAE